jgi:SulP family sulfate permease
VVIGVTQIRDALGLTMEQVPRDFLDRLAAYAHHLDSLNPWAAGLSSA